MPDGYLLQMLKGFALTVLIEAPILLVGLAPSHSWRRKLLAALWLTACTYPIVWLTLPQLPLLRHSRAAYLVVAETFAPLAECLLFWLALDRRAPRRQIARDCVTIVAANLASFVIGEML